MHFSTVYPISTAPHPPTKMLEFIHLSICLSACQSVFPPVSLSVFSVFIRKQVSITRKFHNHYDDETQYTDSHTTARKHSKIVSMIRKYHNHKLQTTPWHREEEPLNHHKTPGRQIKQSNQLSLPHQDDCNTRMDIK